MKALNVYKTCSVLIVPCTGSGTSAWDSWVRGSFQAALAAAPLDLAEAWAAAVRFAVNALAYNSPQGMDAVLQIIIQQPPQGKHALHWFGFSALLSSP